MGEWKTVFDSEIEGRPVKVNVYETIAGDEVDDDTGIAVRIITTVIRDYKREPESKGEDGPTLMTATATAGNSITLEPHTVDDLEEELMEIGFSAEAAAQIASTVASG